MSRFYFHVWFDWNYQRKFAANCNFGKQTIYFLVIEKHKQTNTDVEKKTYSRKKGGPFATLWILDMCKTIFPSSSSYFVLYFHFLPISSSNFKPATEKLCRIWNNCDFVCCSLFALFKGSLELSLFCWVKLRYEY